MKKYVIVLLALAAVFLLSACQKGGDPSTPETSSGASSQTSSASSSVSSSSVSSGKEESSQGSSEAESETETQPEESEEEPVYSEEESTSETSEEETTLPSADVDDPDFAAAFENCSINQAFHDEIDLAASTMQMVQVYNEYAKQWEDEVDNLYKALLEMTDGNAREELKWEQGNWISASAASLESIKSEAGSGSTASLTVATKTMEYYRNRAQVLSSVYYQLTGETGID